MPSDKKKTGTSHPTTPIGQYYLLDKIAQGGMAEIFKGLAYDLHGIKKTVVIKKILPNIAADPEFINMLINEAKIAVMLSHGNIAQIYDLGKVGDDYFMVMEYVEGKSLSQIHRRSLKMGSTVPVEYVCYLISEVANGLNYMHRRSDEQGRNLGIIHRDISPQNVIISYSGTVKIIDFGIAKAAVQLNITESGVLKGKFAYMSPEQAKGESVDHRTDIFSLGVILHELLTGRRLFKGKDKKETLKNVRKGIAPKPSEIRSALPAELDNIVMKALSRDPKNRYMWASELHDDLVRFLHTSYPEFQPSSISDYITKLFKDETDEQAETDEDAKTPFLIIDHTQSAIMPEKLEITGITKIPPQLSEFMLDEDTPLPSDEELKGAQKEIRKFRPGNFIRKKWKGIAAIGASGLLVLLAAFVILAGRGIVRAPAFLGWLQPRTFLVITVTPQDAEVTFGNRKLEKKVPYKIKNLPPEKSFKLIVEKEGYIPYFHAVSLNRGEKREMDIVLTPEPPHYAEITISSTPSGATIFYNESETNLKTPSVLKAVKPNVHHSIALYLRDYQYWTRDIILKPDEESSIDAVLSMDYGSLQVVANVEGADVFINDERAGTTPYEKKDIEPGTFLKIRVEKSGYTSWERSDRVKAGTNLLLRPVLKRTKAMLIPSFLRDLDKPKTAAPPETAPEEPLNMDVLPSEK